MTLDPRAGMLAFVDQRIGALLARPDGWGPPESVELQLLLLIEMRHTVLGLPVGFVDAVNERYSAFIERAFPGSNSSLASRLGLVRRASQPFIETIGEFLERERGMVRGATVPRLPRVDGSGPSHLGDA